MANQHYKVEAAMEWNISLKITFNSVHNYNHLTEEEVYKRLRESVWDIQKHISSKIEWEHSIETTMLDGVDFSVEVVIQRQT